MEKIKYSKSLSNEFKSPLKGGLIVIFTLIRLYIGYSWLMAGIDKLAWLSGEAGKSSGMINGLINNLANSHGSDPLHLNDLLAWASKNIFLAFPGMTDLMVVASEILIGLLLILGVKVLWVSLLAMFLNTQYITAGAANNFGYIWTNLGLMGFSQYAEAIGVSGWLKSRKGKPLVGDKLLPWLCWP